MIACDLGQQDAVNATEKQITEKHKRKEDLMKWLRGSHGAWKCWISSDDFSGQIKVKLPKNKVSNSSVSESFNDSLQWN